MCCNSPTNEWPEHIRASKVTFIEALTDSISASWLAWNKHTHTQTVLMAISKINLG